MPTEIRVLTSQNKSLQTKIGVRKTKDTELLKPGLNVSSRTFFFLSSCIFAYKSIRSSINRINLPPRLRDIFLLEKIPAAAD